MIRRIMHDSRLLAVVITRHFCEFGNHFVTPDEFSQQLGYMRLPAGTSIQAHAHNPVEREVQHTLEVLILKKGKLRVDFYDEACTYVESLILHAGDTILLAAGGHGFEVLEEVEMIEVKQGPYVNDKDKTRFAGISAWQVRVRDE